MISIDDFKKIELKTGVIKEAERVEGSDKLMKLLVDLGEENPRQILAGIGKAYEPEKLIGRQIIVVANLEPRKLMGLESNGMLLAASDENGAPVLLAPDVVVPPGSGIK
ncbi:MAG: methionine--tRNA ligase subunit beta [Candidatus Jorgensenbacteria bacterium]|nr:methionine--tRNA ligase subunit beta [Candidatus Jorgensenbacteria bacterium]